MSKSYLKISFSHLVLFCALIFSVKINAQSLEKELIYEHELMVGGGLHTNGWNLSFLKITNKGGKPHFWETDIWTLKHPQEIRINSNIAGGRSYIYDKINNFASFQAGFGRSVYLIEKERKGSVAILFTYSGGLALGVMKPVYMNVIKFVDGAPSFVYVDLERYDPNIHNSGIIQGRGPFTSGLSELSILPGVYGKVGGQVRYKEENRSFSSLEVGLAVNAFYKKVPIMEFSQNKQVFISLYLGLRYGYKWNK